MNKDKIAFVVQRYGLDVNGGAEYLCRELAEHMTKVYDVSVFTSCAKSYSPWDNYYEQGLEKINGVDVYRYKVEKVGSEKRLEELFSEMRKGNEEIDDELIEELGPYCPSLIDELEVKAKEYKAVIFITYMYYTTVKGLKLNLENSILMPTAHDEPPIYWHVYENLFNLPKAILYNTIEEKKFLCNKFGIESKKNRLDCAGIDIPDTQNAELPPEYKCYKNYIIYVGRISNGKNYRELNKYFIEYKKRNPSDLKLIVVGSADNDMNITCFDDIIYTGFVSEEEKVSLMCNARLLVLPSKYESLSLVILESMAVKRPILVNGYCEVLKGQCTRSNAGLYYTDYFEFEECLNYILNNKEAYAQMCENGYKFVSEKYNWDRIVDNVSGLVEEI